MKFLHIAWDFDGTLYNSYPHIIYCLTEALRSFGVTDSRENITNLAHITLGHAYRYYAPLCNCTAAELANAYRKQTEALGVSDRIVAYPGIPELLRDITLAGGRNHICSNRSISGCKMYLHRDGLDGYFDVWSCPDVRAGLQGKPEPDLMNLILEERGIAPEGLIMVGDRNLDIEAAHAVGAKGCFFDPDGFATVTCHPEYSAPDLQALRRILLG